MSYEAPTERSLYDANLPECQRSCCIHTGIWLHNFWFSSGAHGSDVQNWLWKVMEIEEKELDEERWGSLAILFKN